MTTAEKYVTAAYLTVFVVVLAYVLIIALVNPLGSLVAMRYADALERKWQLVCLALTIAVGQ